jgi:plasmid stabilization system protein ParE
MTYELLFKAEAEADIQEAFEWYEARADGLGADFLRAVDAALENILRHPRAYQVLFRSARHANLNRFPYGMYFVIRENDIVIVACVHKSRDPAVWMSRV